MKSKLIILTSHSTFESGGVGTHLATMKSSLSNKNHTFILGLSKKESFVAKVISTFLNLIGFESVSLIVKSLSLYKELNNVLQKNIGTHSYDIITHDRYSALAAIIAKYRNKDKISITQVLHAPFSEQFLITSNNKTIYAMAKFLDIAISKQIDKVIGVDQLQIDLEKKIECDNTDKKYIVVPNAIDVKKLDLVNTSAFGRNKYAVIVRHLHEKNGVEYGVRGAINYISKSSNPIFDKLLVIGSGPLKEKLHKEFHEDIKANLIEFKGSLSNMEALSFIKNAEISIVPSIPVGNYIEATSLTMLESMYLKTPLIASNIGGLADTINHLKNGFLVEPREHEQITEIIFEIEKGTYDIEKIKETAYVNVLENYSSEKWMNKILKFSESE
ncbi:glycosyltransferase family 4 protein [Nonlabens arenilitoris]|nr:glycosyltransferase [Nonlabens arenilitoris]